MNSIHVITVKNNATGRKTIAQIRSTLRKQKRANPAVTYRVQVYGRGHRFGMGRSHIIRTADGQYLPKPGTHGWDNRYQSNLPHNLAQRLAVYVTANHNTRW